MSIRVICPSCSGKINAADKFAGKRAKCPKCGGIILIPSPQESPSLSPVLQDAEPVHVVARPKKNGHGSVGPIPVYVSAGAVAIVLLCIGVGRLMPGSRRAGEPTVNTVAPALKAEPGDVANSPIQPTTHRPEPAPLPQYEIVAIRGAVEFAWISPASAKDREIYRRAIRDADTGQEILKVLFWTDRAMIPRRLPMSDRQAETQVGQYDRNRRRALNRLRFFENGNVNEEFSPP
jgi:hypothetical protein